MYEQVDGAEGVGEPVYMEIGAEGEENGMELKENSAYGVCNEM